MFGDLLCKYYTTAFKCWTETEDDHIAYIVKKFVCIATYKYELAEEIPWIYIVSQKFSPIISLAFIFE